MKLLKAGRPINKEKAIAQLREEDDPFVRMNVNIRKSFHKKIKQRALDDSTTVTEIVFKAINDYLSK
jgi:hypothetical protein